MKALFVGAVMLLAGSVMADGAAAQLVRADARIRVSDDVTIGVSFGRPYAYRGVLIRPRGRVGRRYSPAYWRAFERRHERWHRAIEREYDRLQRALSYGRITPRQFRIWLRETDRQHDALFGGFGHRYGDRRWDDRFDRDQRWDRYDRSDEHRWERSDRRPRNNGRNNRGRAR